MPAPCGHTSFTVPSPGIRLVSIVLCPVSGSMAVTMFCSPRSMEKTKRPGCGLDGVVDADLASGDDERAHLATHGKLHDLLLEGPVEVPLIVRMMLEMPDELSGIGVDGQRRIGVERIAGDAGPVHRPLQRTGIVRIPGAEEGEPCRRIVAAGRPHRRAGSLIAGHAIPAVAARLARLRDGVDPPDYLSGISIESRRSEARPASRRRLSRWCPP